ncbi:MAG: hypothetical protein KDD60_06060 [Bdellovibrionales bacterium]|nr:hypothetical protein [Bdellovibrionales bacterium]
MFPSPNSSAAHEIQTMYAALTTWNAANLTSPNEFSLASMRGLINDLHDAEAVTAVAEALRVRAISADDLEWLGLKAPDISIDEFLNVDQCANGLVLISRFLHRLNGDSATFEELKSAMTDLGWTGNLRHTLEKGVMAKLIVEDPVGPNNPHVFYNQSSELEAMVFSKDDLESEKRLLADAFRSFEDGTSSMEDFTATLKHSEETFLSFLTSMEIITEKLAQSYAKNRAISVHSTNGDDLEEISIQGSTSTIDAEAYGVAHSMSNAYLKFGLAYLREQESNGMTPAQIMQIQRSSGSQLFSIGNFIDIGLSSGLLMKTSDSPLRVSPSKELLEILSEARTTLRVFNPDTVEVP